MVEEYYKELYIAVSKVCRGYSNLCIINGPGGIGKSVNIRNAFIENNVEPVEVTGDVSEAYLYRLLYENNGKVIWFREVTKLFTNHRTLNLLKSATETDGKRILKSNNYSYHEKGLPKEFECTCRFVFDYNSDEVVRKSLLKDFEAFSTRGDVVKLNLSHDDIVKLMRKIAVKDWQKEVTEFIIGIYSPQNMVRLNLRTQARAFATYLFAKETGMDWRNLVIKDMYNVTNRISAVYSIIGKGKIRTRDLKIILMKRKIVNSKRSADRFVEEMLYTGDLVKVGKGERNFYVRLRTIDNNNI